MKKILAFLAAVVFVGSSTLAVSACGVSQGQVVPVEIKDSPKEAKTDDNPIIDYVYNNKYVYNNETVIYTLAVSAQLISDKLNNNPNAFTGPLWEELYKSQEWQRGYFSSFNYDYGDETQHGFSYQGASDKDFIINVKDNDLSVDDNIIRFYWFLTSPNPWSSANPSDYQPSKNTITIPDSNEFNDEVTTITQTGYVHFYLKIGDFRIDFSAIINFDFFKIVDKNSKPAVLLKNTSYQQPFGKVDFSNSEKTFDKVIKNLEISKVV